MTYIFGFESFEKSLEFIQEVSRRELCTMAVVLNKNFFIQKVNVDNIGSASYIAAIGIEGHEKLASYRKRVVTGIASEKGAKDITSSVEGKTDIFQSPWYAFKQPRIGFFSLFSRITEFNNVVSSCVSAKEDIGFAAVSVSYGGCAWMEYTLPEGSKGFNKAEETALALFKKGAFFDRPTGKLAEAVYAKAGSSYVNHIKRIKNMVDPGHLINPGIPINLQ